MADVPVTRQVDRAVDLVFAEQAVKGTLPDPATGVRIPFSTYNKTEINQSASPDPRNRKNGMTGASQLDRTEYALTGVQGPLMVGAYDLLWQGVQRNAYTPAAPVTQLEISQLQSMTVGGLATFTASPIAAGVRFGQWHQYSSGLNAADLNKPLLVIGVTATTIQYAGAFTAVGAPADFSFSIKKNVGNGAQRWPFAIEDRSENRDFSEMLDFSMIQRLVLTAPSRGPVNLSFDFLPLDFTKRDDTDSPYYNTIAESLNEYINSANCRLNLNGTWINYETFSVTWDLRPFTDNTNAKKPVDGAQGSTVMTGNFTILDDQEAEDAFDASLIDEWNYLALEGVDPDGNFCGLVLPRVKLRQPSGSARGEDRFSTRSFQMEISEDVRGGAYARTMALFSSD